MAHEITQDDVMVSFGGVRPWHADETTLDGRCIIAGGYTQSAGAALRLAKLDWPVVLSDTMTPDGQRVPGYKCTRRGDSGKPLGVVSDRYTPLSNAEALDVLAPALDASGRVQTIGTVRGGTLFFASVDFGARHEIVPGDPTHTYAMVTSGHDGGSPLKVTLTSVRAVCANTIRAGETSGQRLVRHKHTAGIVRAAIDVAKLVQRWQHQADAAASRFGALARAQVSNEIVDEILGRVFPLAEDATDRQVHNNRELLEEVLEYQAHGRGTEIPGVKGTAWGLLNAITEYYDHGTASRPRGSEHKTYSWDEVFDRNLSTCGDAKERALGVIEATIAKAA
jgi:phage/plasmid-like protein (TIGR03299 family)